jgi:hypothetical protein
MRPGEKSTPTLHPDQPEGMNPTPSMRRVSFPELARTTIRVHASHVEMRLSFASAKNTAKTQLSELTS